MHFYIFIAMQFVIRDNIDLAKPKSGTRTFFFPARLKGTMPCPGRTRTWVVRLGAQCTDHWTTEQSHGIGMPAVQLTMHVKSSTLYGRTVVRSYIQIFLAWWVTSILFNYGAMLCQRVINVNPKEIRTFIRVVSVFPLHIYAVVAGL